MADPTRTGPGGGPPAAADASTGELLKQLSDQMSRLVRQEIELGKAEVSEKGKQIGIGAGMFGGAGVVGLYAGGALIATIIALLSEVGLATWLAALIVTVVLAAIAGVLALQGRNQVQKGTPPADRTLASVKQDTDTIKTRAQAGRNAR